MGWLDRLFKGAPPANSAVGEALAGVAAERPRARLSLYDAILESRLWFPATDDGVSYHTIPGPQPEVRWEAFTTLDYLQQHCGADCPYLMLTADAFLPLALQHGATALVIDRDQPTTVTLSQAELQMLSDRLFPTADGSDYISQVAEGPALRAITPTEMELLHQVLGGIPQIQRAILFTMAMGQSAPEPTLGLVLRDNQEAAEVLRQVNRAMVSVTPLQQATEVRLLDAATAARLQHIGTVVYSV